MNDSYLITGATGFIGSCLTRFLVSQGENVHILVRNKALNWRLEDIKDSLNIYECDILDNDLTSIVAKIKPTVVFHTAAYGAIPTEQIERNALFATNIMGLVNLIDSLKKEKIRKFVNTGSSSEYGIKEEAMKESDVLSPINDYGISKAAAALYAQKVGITEALPIVTLRLFSPYGYYDEKNRLIPYVISHALKNEPIKLTNSHNVRDFIHIDDVIAAYVATLQANIRPGDTINIGSGEQHAIGEIVDTVISIIKSKSEVQWNAMQPQSRQIEPKVWKANIDIAKEKLQWHPKILLVDGLQKTIEWSKNNMSFYEYN